MLALAFAVGVIASGLFAPSSTAAQERPAPSCGDRCQQHAQEVLRRCEAAGGENCGARAREAHSACVRRCENAGGEKPERPACGDRCQEHAQRLLRRCEAGGGENCGARAREAYNACVQRCENAGGEKPERPACGDRCQQRAQQLLARCEAAGGENCGARARAAYNACVQQCENPGGQRPERPGARP